MPRRRFGRSCSLVEVLVISVVLFKGSSVEEVLVVVAAAIGEGT